mmetsp:Transcript_15572/g.23047  ORF Transcript_15572/g.23047 Transcript_15572/m.23047 type:complete len:284 (-) Transcript_15572:82-933(-)
MFDEKTGCIWRIVVTKYGTVTGRKRDLDATGGLGLVLYWYRTKGSVARATAMAFGLTSTPMYKWLKFSRQVLLFALQKHPLGKVIPPTQSEVDSYIKAIGAEYPILERHNVWGAADGLKVHLQKSSNWAIQNQFYNGWVASTYINHVFVFAPDGRIRMCTINAPGPWHDSTMAEYGIYDKLQKVYSDCGGKIVVDSAFNVKNNSFLIKSSQKDPNDAAGDVLNCQATSLRQLSEHGMRTIQAQFPRLTDRLRYEEFGGRKIIMQLMVLLYNFQAKVMWVSTKF